ncbi:dTMP kinase [Francisella marina]|uniref:Thymidylate kinase n=2 Tax=Francisella marina TaxID=2249302 RepID=A0ABX5ZGU5_9GAMM|nr:dTMP kinase [Francisella marina]QEO57676.1 dTMP kinase [Francisella marina]QEO60097.1 dTMP kinase [Francisella marina]
MSKFIVIEGLDGAGKSTAIGFIKKYLDSKSLATVYTREPGGTKVAEEIRALALKDCEEEMVASDTELLLMYASRVQHVEALIKPALESNLYVVSDRFYWSSMAYQGGGRELGFDKLNALNETFLKDCQPDLTIYLDIDPAVGLARAGKVGSPDRIEKAGLAFFDRTRDVFKSLVTKNNNAYEIDASQPIDAIEKEIYTILDKYF